MSGAPTVQLGGSTSAPLRVGFVSHYGAAAYGSNLSLLNLIDGLLARRDVAVQVAYAGQGNLGTVLAGRGVPAMSYPLAPWVQAAGARGGRFARLVRNLRWTVPLARALARRGCDVVYTNSSVIPAGAMAARWLGRPHVWHVREFGREDYGLEPDWGRAVFQRTLGTAAGLVCVSEAVRRTVLAPKDHGRARVIYNGIAWAADFERGLRASEPSDRRDDDWTFAIVGLVAPFKGQDLAIRALAEVSTARERARLIVAGDGEGAYPVECRALAARLGVAAQVEFRGYVTDVASVYREADAILVCSRQEASGRVAVEAMASARPVIGRATGGTLELIQDGETGLLFTGDAGELAVAMRRLMDDRAWARRLARQGWEHARERYTIERCCDSVYAVIEAAVRGGRVG